LTAPANGTSYIAPANITLTATASDPEGKLSKVEFYRGSTLLGTDTSSPFSYSWTNVAAGTYSLTAVAYDTAGAKTTSNAATVTVGSTSNKPPTVSLTAPSSGATFTAGATISLAATASDPEGKLAKVEFYRGTTLLGTDTSSPFTFSWSNVAAGSYSLTAVAYDTAGAKTTSAAVPVTVSSTTSTPPRYVAFQKSADHDTLVTSYRLNVYANGATPSTATPIASVSLGKPTPDASGNIQVDELSFFTGLGVGTYTATVSAVGSGGSTQSSAVSFTR
jgi:predicted phage tail protein